MNDFDRLPTMADVPEGMGDLWNNLDERYNKYWDIFRRGQPAPGQTPVAVPPFQCPPGMDPGQVAWAQFFQSCVIPSFRELLEWFKRELECGTFFVKNPNWVEPTITSIRIDKKRNVNDPAILPADGVAGAFRTVLRVDVPDLMVGVVWGIGQLLDDCEKFANVEWREIRNGATLLDGQYFFQKADPTNMQTGARTETTPIIIPPLGFFELQARNTLAPGNDPAQALARITGHLLSIKELSTGGSYSEFHVR